MKSIAYLVLVTIISVKAFLPNMDLCCDINKIPTFFDHYQLHKITYGDTFWEFVEGHYLYNDDEYGFIAADPEHANLPFRENHQNTYQWIFISKMEKIQLQTPDSIYLNHWALYTAVDPAALYNSPFQPPKV